MNKVLKKTAQKLLLILFITTPMLNARGGSSFAGSFGGSMFGSMLGSAMTRPRPRTVVVEKSGGEVSRDEVARLEENLRGESKSLENIVRNDLNKLYDRIRKLELENRDFKDQLSKITQKYKNIRKEIKHMSSKHISSTDGM